MPKLRIFFVISLVLLGVILVFTVFRPIATGGEYSEVQMASLLEKEDQWIIELHIINHEGEDTSYTINVLVDEELCTQDFSLEPEGLFKYVHHIYKGKLRNEEVPVAVYKQGEDTPLEETIYYLE